MPLPMRWLQKTGAGGGPITVSGTGWSPGSVAGARPSRWCTANRAGRCRSPRAICRSGCPHFSRTPLSIADNSLTSFNDVLVPFIFPWYLAITQAWVVPVIQIAELTGPVGLGVVLYKHSGGTVKT